MPLHLNSIVKEDKGNAILNWLVATCTKEASADYVSDDETIIILKRDLMDKNSNEQIGKVVYTFKKDLVKRQLNIIDIDFVLKNETATELELVRKYPKSSDANEYYEAEELEQGGHLQIETVDRHMVEGEVDNTVQKLYLSAFPFYVHIHDDMSEINKAFGFAETAELGDGKIKCFGLAEKFTAPASLFQMGTESDETYTYFIGDVVSFKDASIDGPNGEISFMIVNVDCSMGVIPVAMSKECFDLEKLAVGKKIEIRADIKADFVAC